MMLIPTGCVIMEDFYEVSIIVVMQNAFEMTINLL